MLEPARCTLAVWDLHGGLTAGVRQSIDRATHRRGAGIETTVGRWRGVPVAVGWPLRVTAAARGSLRDALRALASAHPADRLAVVGPAAVGRSGLPLGGAVWLGRPQEPVIAWREEVAAALESLGLAADLLAAVTTAGERPPAAARATAARAAGRWLGGLLSSRAAPTEADATRAVAAALANLLG